VIVDFLKTSVADVLRKRYDVIRLRHAVQLFSVFPQGDNVRMVIEPRGLWEHNAYQTGHPVRARGEAAPIRSEQTGSGSRTGYSGEKFVVNFQNVEVRMVLNVIADFTT